MENGLLLSLTHQQQQQPITFVVFFPRLHFSQLKTTHFHFATSYRRKHHLRFSLISSNTTRSRKWDSNAGTFRSQNFNFNQDEEDEEDEEEESLYGNVKRKRSWWSKKTRIKRKKPRNLLEEAIESIWILKVFKSFGWFSPFILISLLLATGPKAFLTALAIPLVLSVLYLAFDKLWGKMQRITKRKVRMRRKTSSRYANSVELKKERESSEGTRKAKKVDQFWMDSSNGPVNKGSQKQDAHSFGGWDYLDEAGYRRVMPQETSESQRTQKGKLSGSERQSGTPLLVRLLIAVFPFIGFWAKMFW